MLFSIIKSVLFTCVLAQGNKLKSVQQNHRAQQLSNADVQYLAGLSNVKYTNDVLKNILIPRVVGTPNHKKVFNYITNELGKLNWTIEVDEFEDETPVFGKLKFKNIVASLNPDADRYLVLACHYDSKYFENEVFVGATDSAVPCAMMLNLVKVMKDDLAELKDKDLSLKLIFFDGEEAFLKWGPKDSIYGARHLAEVYENSLKTVSNSESVSELQKIDVLVLLDLIGHRGTQFYSTSDDTQKWYMLLAEAEDQLQRLRLLKKPNNQRIFHKRSFYGYIEDDHIPFLQRNVPILHLISYPFPDEWHTSGDNQNIIDTNMVENINKIIRVFIAEYLNLVLEQKKHSRKRVMTEDTNTPGS